MKTPCKGLGFLKVSRLLAVVACGALSACASSTPSTTTTQQDPGAAATSRNESPEASSRKDTAVTLLKSGFGLAGEYAYVIALVRNDSSKSGGTVTASFNLLDASGDILATETQVESFPRPGAVMSLGTQVSVPAGKKPVKVEATVDVEWPGIGSQEPFPVVPATPVQLVKQEFGTSYVAKSTLTNPLDTTLKSPRVSVICYNAAGVPIGGGTDYPDLLPPHGKALTEVDLLTTGKPAKCDLSVSAPA